MKFHVALKNARVKRKWSKAEVARVANITTVMIGHYETGRYQPPLYLAYRLSQILEFSLGNLDCSKLTSQDARDASFKEKTKKLDKQLNDLLTVCNHGV